MKKISALIALLFALLFLFALAGCAPVNSLTSNGLIVGQSYRLAAGDTLNEDLTLVGGSAVLEQGSVVNGSVAILGGSLSIDGEVTGDVDGMGGVVSLGDHALIHGDVNTLGVNISRAQGAVIRGSMNTGTPTIRPFRFGSPVVETGVKAVTDFLGRIFQAFALAALAVLVSLFALRPMERAGDAMTAQPALSGGIGLLTIIVAPAVLIILLITIILSPLSLVGLLILGVAFLFGWVVLGLVTGERLSHMLSQSWSGPVSAGVGTLVLSLVSGILSYIPCIGWLIPFTITIVGIGGVVLTRFGMQSYPPIVHSGMAPAPAVIDVPPMAPPPAPATPAEGPVENKQP
jgi:hypothetical protein